MKSKVVLVRFPFDDLSSAKVRPALCLTEPIGEHNHVVLAFITSQPPLQPLTVSTDVLMRELGVLSDPLLQEVAERLRRLFGL